jgi:hypothetical protein
MVQNCISIYDINCCSWFTVKTIEFSIMAFPLMILFVSMSNDERNLVSIFAQSEEDLSSKKKDPKNKITIMI